MNSFKNRIVDYYSDLINKIDIQTEKVLYNEHCEDEIINLNVTRELFIRKVKEIEKYNLINLNVNTKNGFEDKFCFFIPNWSMVIDKTSKKNEIFYYLYNFNFNDKLGKLVIVNKFYSNRFLSLLE
ncbi:unnamed protein product [Brachionus calyciflorus]|uniref:Uncharacterized protein n=1 Tax=Brachionus calyciflorus TaxID=104777 RepID=A0A814PYD9_9BILA|nr:unnamed protein product [Brachionus calyciflorus]